MSSTNVIMLQFLDKLPIHIRTLYVLISNYQTALTLIECDDPKTQSEIITQTSKLYEDIIINFSNSYTVLGSDLSTLINPRVPTLIKSNKQISTIVDECKKKEVSSCNTKVPQCTKPLACQTLCTTPPDTNSCKVQIISDMKDSANIANEYQLKPKDKENISLENLDKLLDEKLGPWEVSSCDDEY